MGKSWAPEREGAATEKRDSELAGKAGLHEEVTVVPNWTAAACMLRGEARTDLPEENDQSCDISEGTPL